ncbi:dolichol-P-glucose synthetase [Bacteroidia bacterium]|nr:dolichol-P-glucose synthetase [Bacteroidia bacterium]
MSEKLKDLMLKLLKTVVPLVFGVIILYLLLKVLPVNEMILILKQDVNFSIIILSLPFCLFANIARALRWNLLITPLGFKPRKFNLIYAVLGNYGVNLAIPRLGEVWRCSMITQYEKIPFTKLIGTVVTDRLADTIVVLLIFIVSFVLNISYFSSFFVQHPNFYEPVYALVTSFWLYAGFAVVVLAIWLCFKVFKENAFIKKIKNTLFGIWEGIRSIAQMKQRGLFLFYTCLIWIGYFLSLYICLFAFPFTKDLGMNCGLIVFGIGSLMMAVPVQAGIGAWHSAVIAVLMGFGLSLTDAGAFAFTVHTIQAIIFTAMFGLFGIFALPIANRKTKK